ncbi:RsiG family protein [Angustibacter aerolatus]
MTIQTHEGGRRPIDRILSPGFADDVRSLEFAELRSRRHEAEQEEVDLSYARRLLQGRLDLIRAEQAQRASARAGADAGERTDAEFVHDLAKVLSDDGPRSDHGLGRHMTAEPSRVGEHRRLAEQAVDDVQASDPSALGDDELVTAVDHLRRIEQAISENRHKVQAVMDVLTAEVARRYRDGEAHVEDVLVTE